MNRGARASGFSLIELLVAVGIFAVASALAWAGLAAVSRTRQHLAAEQDAFAAVARSVELFARDLGSAVVRPVRDANGAPRPAFAGDATSVSFTRAGYFGAQGTVQSDLERVTWRQDEHKLVRVRWPVLDRTPATRPVPRTLDRDVSQVVLRYLDATGRWQPRWPVPTAAGGPVPGVTGSPLPRAVEFRIDFKGYGEVRRVVELVSGQAVRSDTPGAGS